jgi:hypothetical protein
LLEGLWNGQTIGKRLFHLRVIDQTGLPLRIEQAWVRNLMRVFDALPFDYLVGGISALSNPLMQRFGDRSATGSDGKQFGLVGAVGIELKARLKPPKLLVPHTARTAKSPRLAEARYRQGTRVSAQG